MSIKLLVADDSITIQKVIGIIFGGDDYSLTVVDNGKTAIEKAIEVCPDVLLIDALMPGMTGYEVSEAVRATPALANKPILILTGSFEPFDEDKAKKCGADDFLAKPFESQQIISKVKELAELGLARESAALAAKAQSIPQMEPEPPAAVFAPTAEPFAEPAFTQQNEVPPVSTQSDIWGAFTTEAEPISKPQTAPLPVFEATPIAAPFEFETEPDVFAIVKEESDAQLVQPAVTSAQSEQNTGSQWIPVEEHTFEFEEETISELPPAAIADQTTPVVETTFGDISFEDEEPVQPATVAAPVFTPVVEPASPAFIAAEQTFAVFDEPSSVFAAPPEQVEELTSQTIVAPAAEYSATEAPAVVEAPVFAAAPAALTEDQLRAAISSASKEVIERIVWEVVPDLAETLIKEAIRKIREGL
ncbi:MAG: hypothetical protein A2X82_10300 [Geobacteraceae bacterium GWC2_55_20]|nr:MAG: hypothetical protein A2X82_10300 [Geobacteraceae bacterium GWC2_55_20]HBA72058.1 response regulator [Geobacter sp.]